MNSHTAERPSRGELIDAGRTIKILEQRSKLRPVERKKLDEARMVIERERLFVAQAAEATLREKPNQNMKNALISTSEGNEDPERALDALIERVETRFLEWGEEMIPKIREHVPEGELRDTLEFPFKAMELNQGNVLKNIYELRKIKYSVDDSHPGNMGRVFLVFRNKGSHEAKICAFENLDHFFYGNETVGSEVASYSPTSRTLHLGRIDPETPFGLLALHHELIHVGQDTALRMAISSDREWRSLYSQPPTQPPRLIVNCEAQAEGCSIELLNVLLQDKLKNNPHSTKTDDVYRTLGVPVTQQEAVLRLLLLARSYYPEGMGKGFLPRNLVSLVAKNFEIGGLRCAVWSKTGISEVQAEDIRENIEIPHVCSANRDNL